MSTTIIGMFDAKRVERVTGELKRAGFAAKDLEILAVNGGGKERLVAELVERGFDDKSAHNYADAAAKGHKLLAASGSESLVRKAVDIMEQHELGTGEDADAEQATSVPVAEEELSIGKHRTVQGGVRVTSHVEERPVEQTVRLREEQVEVERRPTDRELSTQEADQVFQDRTIEMTETVEEVEIGKEARVVEEVVLRKRSDERQEKVKDNVRHTDVEIEELKPARAKRG